jgi:hypothetical protein
LRRCRHDRVEAPWLTEGPISDESFRLQIDRVLVPTLRLGDIIKERNRNKRNKRNKRNEGSDPRI